MDNDSLYAGVELGGTKCIAVVARDRTILHRQRWPTGDDPELTLDAIAAWLADQTGREPIAGLGIATFGPVCLDRAQPEFGRILDTPKLGWSGADIVGPLTREFPGPFGFDTDVAGAALAEGRWGASRDCAVHVYITIGTGIGGGIVIAGRPHHGIAHPEIGHVRVRRLAGDTFAGICPFHGDCLEGLASGPAIAARTGCDSGSLTSDHPVWERVSGEIADLLSSLILTLSPRRIVIGGGVGVGQPALLPLIRSATTDRLGHYLPQYGLAQLQNIIAPPALGEDAGILGAVALAIDANKAAFPGSNPSR